MDNATAAPATTERRERRDSQANRLRILRVAKRLFAERGVSAVTMRDIARAAGVGQGTLYRHYAHKGDLCLALAQEDIALLMERVEAILADPAAGAPLERLDRIMDARVRLMESHLHLFAEMAHARALVHRARPFRSSLDAWTHARVVALLQEAVERGDLAPLDVSFVADAVLAILSPPVYHYQREVSGYSQERVLVGMRALVARGSEGTPLVPRNGGLASEGGGDG